MIPTQLILKEKIQRRGQKEKYRKQRLSSIVILASFVVVLFVVVQVWTWNTLIAQRDPQDNVMFWKKEDSSAAQPKQLPNNPRILQPQDTITANDSNYHPPLRRTQQQLKQELEIFQDLPILIIGGTDGSGTRAVVDALRKLGTPIVSDDPSTFDVHGKEMFRGQGWPALVELILSHTHGSGNFEWDDLPSKVQHTVVGEITILLKCWDKRYQNMMEIVDLQRVQHPGMEHFPLFSGPQIFSKQRPTKVKYAIKAPVSMLLLPILTKFMGKIKFLHVLRDGRDIALSSNQSPVLKFYNLSYPDDFEQRLETYSGALSPVRGIQLWQDWNLQVRDWARSHPQILEYHSIRSEELIGQDTRWDHWQQMADIVGFSESTDLLCCLSKSQTKDYGKSASIHNPDDIRHAFPNGKVHGRRRLLENENEKQSSPQDPIILIGDFAKWEYQLSKLKEQEELTTETRVTFLEMGNDLLKRYQATTNLVDRPYYLKYIQDKLDELAKSSSQIVMETDTLEQLATDYKGWVLRQENIKPNDLKNVTVLEEFRSNGKSIWRRFKKFQASNQIVPKDAVDILKVLNLLTTLQNQIDTAMKQQQLKYRQPTDQQDIYKKLEETILKQRAATVQQRYGKWQRILADKPKLSEHLHREGEKALKIFGYEPFVPSNTSTFSTNAGFLCTASVICAMHNS